MTIQPWRGDHMYKMVFGEGHIDLAVNVFRAAAAALGGRSPEELLTPTPVDGENVRLYLCRLKYRIYVANTVAVLKNAEPDSCIVEEYGGNVTAAFQCGPGAVVARLQLDLNAEIAAVSIQTRSGDALTANSADGASRLFWVEVAKAAAMAVANNNPRHYRGCWNHGRLELKGTKGNEEPSRVRETMEAWHERLVAAQPDPVAALAVVRAQLASLRARVEQLPIALDAELDAIEHVITGGTP
jgi:hypothetical protein